MTSASSRFGGNSGPLSGVKPPRWLSGIHLYPPGFIYESNSTANANTIYFAPIYFPRAETFAGMKTTNRGAGDNGKKILEKLGRRN